MTKYPTMDQYNDTVQHPATAFSDAVLKGAKIKTNAMGLPMALGGGFALTYTATAGSKKYAVRCFHKEAKELDLRYGKIDSALKAISSNYFVGFEYQKTGVLVLGARFPIVKMDWVDGATLGIFLEDNFDQKTRIEKINDQFTALEAFLRSKGIAHGDLQNGNVIVDNDVRLIDYDGMYVPGMATGQGAELGHKHFQHPKRSSVDFGPNMDRFSFIVINLSLRALSAQPKLFEKHSSGENILFTASDFANPAASPLFSELKSITAIARDVENFAKICMAPIKTVPSLQDFLAGSNIPTASVVIQTKTQRAIAPASAPQVYVPAHPVFAANDYAAVCAQIGNVIEIVGKVVKVHAGRTKYGKPYWFVFFNDGKKVVKINIWSDTETNIPGGPSQSWVGTWFSITGLVDPVYSSRYGDSVSITPSSKNSLREITEKDAMSRLASKWVAGTISAGFPSSAPASSSNKDLLNSIKPATRSKHVGVNVAQVPTQRSTARSPAAAVPISTSPRSRNQAILSSLPGNKGSAQPNSRQTPSPPINNRKSGSENNWGKWLVSGLILVVLLMSCAG
jgi:hypothetical protein